MGYRVSVSNFAVKADGISLMIDAQQAVLKGWQSIKAGSAEIKTPIIKRSAASESVQKIVVLDVWVPLGVMSGAIQGDPVAQIRVRKSTARTPDGDTRDVPVSQ